ncbi:MAG: patatin-like phospholipase family protein [Candidatus Nitrosocosmicus sp.]|nr:patatin-like phospholipase family protein [Candidatus Nitrosocosmicus sp.]
MTNFTNTLRTTGGNFAHTSISIASDERRNTETVLVLQGGGSLGAYECGVYQTLYKSGVSFDILAGSSIGAINASIIAAAQNANTDASEILKSFWFDLAENFTPMTNSNSNSSASTTSTNDHTNPFMSWYSFLSPPTFDKMISIWSSMWSVFYGNSKAFHPKWLSPNSSYYFDPSEWTYMYDKEPLKRTLNKYIDFDFLKKIKLNDTSGSRSNSTELEKVKDQIKGNNHDGDDDDGDKVNQINKKHNFNTRLIITSTDIQKGKPVIFDNAFMDIDVDMIVACAGYPFYGIKWSIIDERYLWDGSLLSNTPIMDVMRASPNKEKEFYVVDVFPRQQKKIPHNMIEVWHRARDIMFMDKTDENIEMLKTSEKYSNLLKKMYKIIHSDEAKVDKKTKEKLKELEDEYHRTVQKHGTSVVNVTRIGRNEDNTFHYLFEDADFSKYRIEKLMLEGEKDAMNILESKERTNAKKRKEKKREDKQ